MLKNKKTPVERLARAIANGTGLKLSQQDVQDLAGVNLAVDSTLDRMSLRQCFVDQARIDDRRRRGRQDRSHDWEVWTDDAGTILTLPGGSCPDFPIIVRDDGSLHCTNCGHDHRCSDCGRDAVELCGAGRCGYC